MTAETLDLFAGEPPLGDTLLPPSIGSDWPGQGGIYAGVVRGREGCRDTYLVVAQEEKAESSLRAAVRWAHDLVVEEHADFALPTAAEQGILYANTPELFEPDWYWSASRVPEREGWVLSYNFGFGAPWELNPEHGARRARAVRRISIMPRARP